MLKCLFFSWLCLQAVAIKLFEHQSYERRERGSQAITNTQSVELQCVANIVVLKILHVVATLYRARGSQKGPLLLDKHGLLRNPGIIE
jgi:hypothetical protein